MIEELGEKEHNYKDQILAALNSAGLPGPPYTWEGARKASNFYFTSLLFVACFLSCF